MIVNEVLIVVLFIGFKVFYNKGLEVVEVYYDKIVMVVLSSV